MRTHLPIILLAGFLCTCLGWSCTKKHTAEVDNETQSVADYAQIQNEFLSVMSAVFNQAIHSATIGTSPQCDSLRLISGDRNFGGAGHITPVYSLDFDNSCSMAAWDGKTRSGSVRVRVTAPVSQPGSRLTILLSGYTANGVMFSGDSIVLKSTAYTADSTTFDASVHKGSAASDDFTIRYQISGKMVAYPSESPSPLKNRIRFWGNGSGTNRQGTNFTVDASSGAAEQKIRSCKYISSGVTKVIPSGFKERLLDYGNGDCNDDASFNANNNTIAIKLK